MALLRLRRLWYRVSAVAEQTPQTADARRHVGSCESFPHLPEQPLRGEAGGGDSPGGTPPTSDRQTPPPQRQAIGLFQGMGSGQGVKGANPLRSGRKAKLLTVKPPCGSLVPFWPRRKELAPQGENFPKYFVAGQHRSIRAETKSMAGSKSDA